MASSLAEEVLKLETQVGLLRTELEKEKKARKEKEDDYDALNWFTIDLRTQRNALKEELRIKEPLFNIGVAVRLRFLEAVHNEQSTLPKALTSQESIIEGNAAAHAGSGLADANIFQNNWINETRKAVLEKTFESLYYCKPSMYQHWSPKMQQATNHEVTIRTLRALNKSGRLIRERQSALEHYLFIKAGYEKMSKKEFESDPEVDRRLGLLKEMTEKIVQIDRLIRPEMSTPT